MSSFPPGRAGGFYFSVMYEDKRIRTSNRPTPVGYAHKAFVFGFYNPDGSLSYKVILAPNDFIAWQRIRDFSTINQLDFFWILLAHEDFEVINSQF